MVEKEKNNQAVEFDYTKFPGPEEQHRTVVVVWQKSDGAVAALPINLETDVGLLREMVDRGDRAVTILAGLNLDLVVNYPEAFGLLVESAVPNLTKSSLAKLSLTK